MSEAKKTRGRQDTMAGATQTEMDLTVEHPLVAGTAGLNIISHVVGCLTRSILMLVMKVKRH